MCTLMFKAALFTIVDSGNNSCPYIRVNKMWPIHIMEYFSALKKKEILTHARVWMNLENTMSSEINQTQKVKFAGTYSRSLE